MVAGAAGIVRKEKKIVAAFRNAGATTSDRAISMAILGLREGLAFRILRRRDILREAGEGRFYLDEPAWESHQAFRRRLATILVITVLFMGLALYFWTTYR